MAHATIAAIATGPAPGGIGVIRLSGPRALELLRLVAPKLPEAPRPRLAYVAEFVDPTGAVLDEGLALLFRAPQSYTGEDVAELHCHGSPRLLRLILERLLGAGARLAEPGEFTRRAFLSGRLDLARAEAVADLVAAESEAAVRAAAAQLSGDLSRRVQELREPLLNFRADIEAALDFPEEVEVAAGAQRLSEFVSTARAMVDSAGLWALERRGARVVIYGPVNAGKSTLFNRLTGSDRALVDPEPGTTRDALEAKIELAGLGVTLVDSAGLRAEPGRIEARGIERTRSALRGCDLAVLLVPPGASPAELAGWRSEVGNRIEVEGKCDSAPRSTWNGLRVSGMTGEGVGALRDELARQLGAANLQQAAAVSDRHADALQRCSQALERAESALLVSTLEVVAGEVGLALAALAEITGDDVPTDLVNRIFQRFCLGK